MIDLNFIFGFLIGGAIGFFTAIDIKDKSLK